MKLLELHNLIVHRNRKTVLEIGNLEVHKGETLALVGPNGSGKTTLLLSLARLVRSENGILLFKGKKITRSKEFEYRRSIGLAMQETLLLNQSVFNNVASGLRFRGLPGEEIEKRVDEWLEYMGISHLRKRSASQISGGEARRVSLARAFVLQPDLLLLDEPFSALDRAARSRLLDDLHNILHSRGMTTVFSTHHPSEVKKLADRVIRLNAGKIQAG